MVKTLKKQGKHVNLTKQNNVENDYSTWSCSKHKECSTEHGVAKTGKLEALRRRCNLHHLLVRKKITARAEANETGGQKSLRISFST